MGEGEEGGGEGVGVAAGEGEPGAEDEAGVGREIVFEGGDDADLGGGWIEDGEDGFAAEVAGFLLVDEEGVPGEDPALVEGVFKGEEGGEKLAGADGAAGTGASCVGRDVSDTGEGGEEVAEGPVKDKEAVFEVEEFLEGKAGAEEVGSLAGFVEAFVFRF